MHHVSRFASGALILLVALHYLHLGFAVQSDDASHRLPGTWRQSPDDLAQAVPGQPVLLYFWGKACRSCSLLSRRTFQDNDVRQDLSPLLPIAVQADDPANDAICDYFQIKGMPTLVLLRPIQGAPPLHPQRLTP